MLRIIAGKARNRKLSVPEGLQVRPTAERVREALFNALYSRIDFEGLRVLDLFSGSGALGLEALSRGAASATFVECDRIHAAVLKQNIQSLGFDKAPALGKVVVSEVQNFLKNKPQPFDLVTIDPPYNKGHLAPTLKALAQGGWLSKDAIVCVEHEEPEDLDAPAELFAFWNRVYGRTTVTLFEQTSKDSILV